MITLREAQLFAGVFLWPCKSTDSYYSDYEIAEIYRVAFQLVKLPAERFIVMYGGTA